MSINPFERKFREFAQNLTKKNTDGHADVIATRSGEVFKDKPFTTEYAGVYKIAQVGQSVAQVVTFLTTAALGVFALQHVIPLSWGIYIAVPLGLFFAFGVENVKRSTLAIAAKHFLKYKEFGFVGVVAILALLVSIGAALYGALELPGVVYAKPARALDGAAVAALTADIDRVQADIDRLQGNLKSGKNWVAENRTLPKLQKERAALVEKREAATKDAAGRSDSDHLEALADRQEKVGKMQVYAIGAAIVAELIFALCTAFIFYYLFRHYAEVNAHAETATQPANQPGKTADVPKPSEQTASPAAPDLTKAFSTNGAKIPTNERQPIGFAYANRDAPTRTQNDATQNVLTQKVDDHLRKCLQCGTEYIYGHRRQMYCKNECRILAWEGRTGRKLKRTGTRQETT